MPERSNGAVSKTVDLPKADPGVRIPLPPQLIIHNISKNAVVAQLAEHQLPKLRVVGSNPIYRS